MRRFGGVFLQMGVMNADFFLLQMVFGAKGNFYFAPPVDRVCILRDLISFWQIRIKIMFALKRRHFVGLAAQRQTGAHRQAHGALVNYRQSAGLAAAAGADFGIGPGAFIHSIGAGAKHFGFAGQLYVYFQSDNGFKLGSHFSFSPKLL